MEPTCGLIANVGRAHLQGFGSFEGVKRTKGELYDWLKAHDCLTFIDADIEHLVAMANERGLGRMVSYSASADSTATVEGEAVSCDPLLRFAWWAEGTGRHEVQTRLIGAYNVTNLLAAVAIGRYFGVSDACIDHALAHYEPTNNRSQLTVTPHNSLIVDAYNANPTSMRAAIDNFCFMQVPNKMAILGDMRELGEASAEEHQRVADYLQARGLDNVWLVGSEFAATGTHYPCYPDAQALIEELKKDKPAGQTILIKGSNSMKLATVADYL